MKQHPDATTAPVPAPASGVAAEAAQTSIAARAMASLRPQGSPYLEG